MAESPQSPIWTEYARHVWKYWWLVVVGGVGGVLTVVSLVASVSLPTWVGLAILFLGLSVAQFLAFKDMRDERNEARDELQEALAPLAGNEFVGQELRLADIVRDLVRGGEAPVINGCRFKECTITGPGFIAMTGGSDLMHCSWRGTAESLYVVVPEDQEIIGVVMFLTCVFERCTFVDIGAMGPAGGRQRFIDGFSYGE